MMPPETPELSLWIAWRSWQGLTPDEAVRLSASWHPRYHFLESRLHTERGYARAKRGDGAGAAADFKRAVVLDHINAPAKAALAALEQGAAPIRAAYDKEEFALESWGRAEDAPELPSIHALAAAEKLDEAIALCDTAHRQYHRLAALPRLQRAKVFAASGERELAINDCRRGLDLDRENAELKALLKRLSP